ncbi:MAG: PaaI family thioesterase, partial [Bacteriovoracaceae bacterium]|nr:PaaI family thioesterase [Bacteriovoracaceae bacterium]
MSSNNHYRNLETMYLAAPINKFYQPTIEVKEKAATISISVDEKMFHSARGVHGSVYFKMLDDAAFFAVNSLEQEFFVLTISFTTKLTTPVTSGELESIGKVVKMEEGRWLAES